MFDVCKNADPKDEKALKLAEKLGVKLTADEKEFAGKQLLKVSSLYIQPGLEAWSVALP